MPVILALDYETTGLDVNKDEVIEVGAILYSTGQNKCLESAGFLVKTKREISPEITKLTGVHPAAVEKFGYDSIDALETVIDMIKQADYIAGQNVIQFDKRIGESWANRHGKKIPEKVWIDTRTDLPGYESKTLSYMAADHGFLNLFPHSALADCQTVVKILSMYDIDAVIERAKQPLVILKAHVSYDTNALAKKRNYRWYPDDKLWWKVVKQNDLPLETGHGEFDVSFVTNLTVDKLWYQN